MFMGSGDCFVSGSLLARMPIDMVKRYDYYLLCGNINKVDKSDSKNFI